MDLGHGRRREHVGDVDLHALRGPRAVERFLTGTGTGIG
jgi:hypothetical protein